MSEHASGTIQAETGALQAEASPLSVAVYRDGEPVFVLDDEGGVYAPDQPEARAAAALALANASAALASVPPPETQREWTMRVVNELAAIGTPAASEAIDAIRAAAEQQAAALQAAAAAMHAAHPTAH